MTMRTYFFGTPLQEYGRTGTRRIQGKPPHPSSHLLTTLGEMPEVLAKVPRVELVVTRVDT